jgi:hypothetical protein
VATTRAGRQHECVLWAGQTAGGIKEILPVATIMRQIIEETEAVLLRAPNLVKAPSQQAAEWSAVPKRRPMSVVGHSCDMP